MQAGAGRVECDKVQEQAGLDNPPVGTRIALKDIALAFLKIGATGFGGGLGMLALLRQEIGARRRWISDSQLSVAVALAQVLPGPFISNCTSYIGHELRGLRGAAVALTALLAPSFLLMCGLSFFYFRYGTVPVVSRMFSGVQPVVVSILVWATWQIGHAHIRSRRALAIGLIAFVALLLRVDVILVVLAAGVANLILSQRSQAGSFSFFLYSLPLSSGQTLPVLPSVWARARDLLAVFLKVGALLFGGGFASIPFLQQEVVQVRHWLTMREFIDGVALGQMTPGPVAITATFIGYKVLGLGGAFLATLAVFLPSFFLLWGLRQVHRRLENNPLVQGFLGGVLPAVTGILLSAAVSMARTALTGFLPALVAVACALLLFRLHLDPLWLILAGALSGLVLYP